MAQMSLQQSWAFEVRSSAVKLKNLLPGHSHYGNNVHIWLSLFNDLHQEKINE